MWGLLVGSFLGGGILGARRTFYKEGEVIRGWSRSNTFSVILEIISTFLFFTHKLAFTAPFHAIRSAKNDCIVETVFFCCQGKSCN